MEHAPETSPEHIEAKIAQLSREIIDLEKKIQGIHSETGSNSPDDQSQEDALDSQPRDILLSKIAAKRDEMVRLHDLLQQKAA